MNGLRRARWAFCSLLSVLITAAATWLAEGNRQ